MSTRTHKNPEKKAEKLISVEEFLSRVFDESSRPDGSTVRRWLNQGALRSRKIGGKWYIYESEAADYTRPYDTGIGRLLHG